MKRFEYLQEMNCRVEGLNKLGKEGWELISIYKIHPDNQNMKFMFKRKLKI